ncbi:GNAT family N-acetyltransferase [Sinorhizobium meliloti]|uniref:GNAT family N-acetyltransferase n=1 Tax=Rhizobium meliloti TaxID=382 RepID=UPI00067F57F8|nr:GNAT family N-acetyltransferase [Sinorhizobium meliloti]UFX13118.1 GNAT family N-acetyltransferase [Sinorhizobium meliloti]
MGATLKTLTHVDYPLVAHLNLEPEQEQFVDPLDLTFSELLNSPHPEFEHPFAMAIGDETVGFFVLREATASPEWAPADAITLHSFRVGIVYQGHGYGKAAIGLAADWISTNRPGIKRLMLSVNVLNITALRVYIKSGFLDTGATYLGPIGAQNILEYKIGSA